MSLWRADLVACGRRPTLRQALAAWFANPGFMLACHYRAAHWVTGRGRAGRAVALLVERRMISCFGCQISARATIGAGVRFPHPLGIVIGEGVVIGEGATIYQGVTLGRRRLDGADYPIVGRGVTLCCGAMVLGPVTLPDGMIIKAGRIALGPCGARSGPATRH